MTPSSPTREARLSDRRLRFGYLQEWAHEDTKQIVRELLRCRKALRAIRDVTKPHVGNAGAMRAWVIALSALGPRKALGRKQP